MFSRRANMARRHTLSAEEKTSYLDAVVCLMKAPPTAGFNNTRSKLDEFAGLHQSQAFLVHDVVR